MEPSASSNSNAASKANRLFAFAHEASLRYVESLSERNVMPTSAAIDALEFLHEPFPEVSSEPIDVLETLDRVGSPATVASTGGRFFGFVVGGTLPVTAAANWLASCWDQNAGNWILSPIAAELESVAATWLLDAFDLPRSASVGFVTGSTMGTFSAIAAARFSLLKRQGWDFKRKGLNGAPRIRIVASEEIHPTNLAALGYAGFGLDDVVSWPTDRQGRVIPGDMPDVDDLTIVLLQAGNINSGASDPFGIICPAVKQRGGWVHVDGAFGLWARVSPLKRSLADGLELADSWSVDGHKWLNLPQDSAIYAARDAEAIDAVFGVQATYLMRDDRRQPNTFTPELSRRARGVEFWTALKTLGRNGIAELVERCCRHAQRFAKGLSEIGYTVLNEVVLNQVVFACTHEAATRTALSQVQNSGVTWLGPTHWKGRFAMRISVSSWATTDEDVELSLGVLKLAYPVR